MTRAGLAVWGVLVAGVVTVAGASVALVASIERYVASPYALSSTSGLMVFDTGDGLGQYKPYLVGAEVPLIGVGMTLVVGAVFVAAATYRSVSSRSRTADSNADAHTR